MIMIQSIIIYDSITSHTIPDRCRPRQYLVSKNVSCVATEALNVEQSGKDPSDLEVHYVLLGADVFIVEGLANLGQVEAGR